MAKIICSARPGRIELTPQARVLGDEFGRVYVSGIEGALHPYVAKKIEEGSRPSLLASLGYGVFGVN